MQWGAFGTGYYAALGPGLGQVNCQPRLVVRPAAVAAQTDPLPGSFRLLDRVLQCRTMMIGVPRPGNMAEFRGSFARNAGGGAVKVGFIQNLLSSTRVAEYGGGAQRLQLWRDGSAIGGGLLDCGTTAPPWFQGQTARLLPPARGQPHGPPSKVECGDNPRWTIPLTLDVAEMPGHALPLTRVTLQNRFRLFAVAAVNDGTYVPICRTEWATDIQWDQAAGLRAQVTKHPTWAAVTSADRVISSGGTANAVLVDRIRRP